MKLFMDNVPDLASQALIIRKLDEALCPTAVSDMASELVTKVGGESEENSRDREEILSRLAIIEAGAQRYRQYEPQSCKIPRARVKFVRKSRAVRLG
jgi:hypothetical protein